MRSLVLEKRECKKLASNQILNLVCRIWVYRGLHLSNPVSNSTYWIQILLSNQIRFSAEHLEGSINNFNFIICYRVLSVERAGTCVVLSRNETFTSRRYEQEIRRWRRRRAREMLRQLQLASVSSYPGDTRPPICFQEELDSWTFVPYCTFTSHLRILIWYAWKFNCKFLLKFMWCDQLYHRYSEESVGDVS